MTKALLCGVLAAATVAGPVAAGEMRIATPMHAATANNVTLTPISNGLALQDRGNGLWSFSFADKSVPEARLTVVVSNAPAGYRTETWDFDIPYYWDGSLRREFAVAIANDQSSDADTRVFLRSSRLMSIDVASVAQLALINQRARKIFDERYARVVNGHRSAEKDDVSVAYWLLLSGRELIEQTGLAIDDVTLKAAGWIIAIAEDPELAGRLLGTDTVPRDEALALVGSLKQREELLTERLVRQISDHIASRRTRDVGCARARGLKNFFDGLDAQTLRLRDPTLRYSLETTTNVALCTVRELTVVAFTPPPTPLDLSEAVSLHAELVAAIGAMENAGREPELRRQASNHAVELHAVIRVLQGGEAAPF